MSAQRSPTVRTFLAVEVTPEIHVRLVALKRELAAAGAAVRWVRDENLHITMKFLGGIPEAQLPEIRTALGQLFAGVPECNGVVNGLGVFPDLARPRTVWVAIICGTLAMLATGIDATLAPLGVAPETRPFAAHITLGRITGRQGWPRLASALRAHWSDEFGVCRFTELVGFRSDLRRDGAVYTKLWTIPFGG